MFDRKRMQEEASEIFKSVSETAPEDYTETRALMDAVRSISINSELIGGTVELMHSNLASMESVIELIGQLKEHIETLYKIIYELAPDYEIIETMAESDEERRALCDAYMNHGEWSNSKTETEHEKSRK